MIQSLRITILVTNALLLLIQSSAFTQHPSFPVQKLSINRIDTSLNYEPKWKKLETLADKSGGSTNLDEAGIKGTINVVFQQGDEKKTTVANVGDPIRDLASQSGQFIKYGCGKGECGTCEALCNGKWIRPCLAKVPADLQPGEDYVIQVKGVKSTATSSGKFFSVKSFFKGFYNNLLGMVGFVITRRAAKKNFDERMDFEDLVAKKAREKKEARLKEKI